MQLNYAASYATNRMDEALFTALLQEVARAGDVLPEARLSNTIAKRRARRLLRSKELYF